MTVLERDVLDLADPHTRDADLVVDLETSGFGEGCVVGLAPADQREVLSTEGGDEQEEEHRDARCPDDHRVALAEGSHPRSHLGEAVS